MRKYLAVKLKQARKFINAIEENVTDQHQQVGDRTVQEQLTWARDWIEEHDPMANEIEILFNSLSKIAPYTYDNRGFKPYIKPYIY